VTLDLISLQCLGLIALSLVPQIQDPDGDDSDHEDSSRLTDLTWYVELENINLSFQFLTGVGVAIVA